MADLLRQLTCGAKFNKNNYTRPAFKTGPRGHQIKPEIKEELLPQSGDAFRRVNKWVEKQQMSPATDDHDMDGDTSEEEDGEAKNSLNLFEGVPLVAQQDTKKDKGEKSTAELEQMEMDEMNRLRDLHKITVSAKGKKNPVPDLMETFAQIRGFYQLDGNLMNNLTICGYDAPTPIQMQGIPIMLEKSKDYSLMACAPTGSGKTVAFLVPVIRDILEARVATGQRKKTVPTSISALILCPTRELAKQIYRESIRLTQGLNIKTKTLVNAHKLQGKEVKADIIISTPNSLCFLLRDQSKGKGNAEAQQDSEEESDEEDSEADEQEMQVDSEELKLNLKHLRWLVIDEADKLFEETKNSFRDQLEHIYGECKSPKLRMALFSATYTKVVSGWCSQNMKDLVRVTVGARNAAAESVNQKLLFVGTEDGKLLSLRNLIAEGCQPPVLIFVQSKERAKDLYAELAFDGINVGVMHSDLTQAERDLVIRNFRMGNTWFLICTELMSRGIDFKGVNLVINYDFPTSTISYVHRIGRTGRADRRGEAVTFFTKADTVNLREIAHIIRNSGSEVPEYMLTLKRRSKKVRKRLQKSAPKRKAINTTPEFERQKRAKRKQLIRESKKKKAEGGK